MFLASSIKFLAKVRRIELSNETEALGEAGQSDETSFAKTYPFNL